MKSDQEIIEAIGSRLKDLRLKMGFSSHEDFANEYGFARMQYWRLEAGKTNPTIKTLHKLLEIHNLSYKEFFSEGF